MARTGKPRGKELTVYILDQIENRLDTFLAGNDADMRDAVWKLRLNLTELRMELQREMKLARGKLGQD